MATVIKRISELEQLTGLSSSANVIIEENGKAKRFSAQNLGKVKTVNGIEPDENGNIEVVAGSGGGGVTSWNDLEDKPFGEENGQVVIEWDGNTEGLISVDTGSGMAYKISDLVIPKEDVIGGKCVGTDSSGSLFELVLTENYIIDADGAYLAGLLFVVDKTTITGPEGDAIEFPSTGCYAVDMGSYGKFVSLTYGSNTIKTIDEKFIPDSIARSSNVVTSVNGMTGDVVIEAGVTEQTQSDWNQNDSTKPDYIKNRTHWEENTGATIEWDGNTEGRDHFTIGLSGNMFKVGDLVPESSEMLGATMHFIMDEEPMDVIVTEDMILSGDGCYMATDMVMVVQRTDIAFGDYSAVAPSTGIYMNCPEDLSYTASITYGSTSVHKIDPKYLPDGVGYEENDVTSLVDKTVDVDSDELYTQISEDLKFVDGETYAVTFNGVEYICIAWTNESNVVLIGNGDIYGGEGMGDDVPFSCDSYDEGGCYLNVTATGTYSIKIDGLKHVIHKIDARYLGIKPLEFYGGVSEYYDGSYSVLVRIPKISISNEDLVAGESDLESGTVYLVYE